ncbi:MAG: nucleotide-binding protein, partial [Sediminibacterium sp.]|nr:nucleotide-binding protein [Sediminibacterium sp.]
TQLTKRKEDFKQELIARIQKGQEILNRQIQNKQQLDDAKLDVNKWNDFNSELLKQSFNNEYNEYKDSYEDVNLLYGFYAKRPQNEIVEFQEKLNNNLNYLNQLVEKVDLMKSQINEHPAVPASDTISAHYDTKNVFIVHGHNKEITLNVARTLEKLGLNPIIQHEKPNEGKTIIEKFETHSDVGFAIILLTDDDLGKAKGDENSNPRARQNVILEMGYFIGKLGRKRVCPLYTIGVELPSDLYGLLYTEIDKAESWKIKIAKELKVAGYEIDVNKII